MGLTSIVTIAALAVSAGVGITAPVAAVPVAKGVSKPTGATTAWQHGRFAVDVPGVVSRSDVVLAAPNPAATDSLPVGNGTLGAAIWAANGLTAQLNRVDTFPDLKSPGQLTIPGLAELTGAPDYTGRLGLHDATFTEAGGGMTAQVYARADKDELVVEVRGANPDKVQTADVHLWSPRTPTASASGAIATLAESWTDTGVHSPINGKDYGASGQTFGTLAALTASGRDVTTHVVDPLTIRVSFKPDRDGSFRVIVGAPKWSGGDPAATAARLLGSDTRSASASLRAGHLAWWHRFWREIGPMKLSSTDGSAEYLENLRLVGLYTAAADSRGQLPGTHGGVANLFNYSKDHADWCAGCYWNFNMRMQVAANLGAGAYGLNDSYFALYRDNLAAIKSWTTSQMGGRPGICVPETMRFNGNGYEPYFDTSAEGEPDGNCDSTVPASWNARTISTGAEVGLWVWQQYQQTTDRAFLADNYSLIAEAARFLLAYARPDATGTLHTSPTNAHEQEWDTHDSVNDIAAMRALFPVAIDAAGLLGRDADLVVQMKAALPHLLTYPTKSVNGATVIAPSYDTAAPQRNGENVGLEPVWPYSLIGDSGPDLALGHATFANRPNALAYDWSFDPIHAARLGLADQVRQTLVDGTKRFQVFPSGFSSLYRTKGVNAYAEWNGVVGTSLQEALVQDYDGLLRIAPAWPKDWSADGTVYVHGRSKVDVQVRDGVPVTVAYEAGSTQQVRVRNPWPGQSVQVVDGSSMRRVVVGPTGADEITLPARAGRSYLIERSGSPTKDRTFAPVSGDPANAPKVLATSTIGVTVPTQLTMTASKSWLVPGSKAIVTATLHNASTVELQKIATSLSGPAGWLVAPVGAWPPPTLAGGADARMQWEVTAPTAGKIGDVGTLSARVTYEHAGISGSTEGQQLLAIGTPPTVGPVQADATTKGSWKGVYGLEGHDIANAGSLVAPGVTVSMTGGSPYTWVKPTSDVRALQQPHDSSRIASTYFGETIRVHVTTTDGAAHKVSFYLLDWDGPASNPRAETATVTDITGQSYGSVDTGNFTQGRYLSWNISGDVTITLTHRAPANTVVSGIFVDPAGG